MAKAPRVVRTTSALRRALVEFGAATTALVPTMGALHEGHLTLVKHARKRARRVIVSIFVNPTQFAPNEDFGSYPRTWKADLTALGGLKVDLIWAPTPTIMYPDGFATKVEPSGPAKVGLEDRFRPHFFSGVATVCTKLFTQVQPDFAMFGEKDYQQLRVITQTAQDLNLTPKIMGVPTVREKDGLAMSSRNTYLSAEERRTAPVLYKTLKSTARRIKAGESIEAVLNVGRDDIRQAGFTLDYLEARHAQTLQPVNSLADGPIRLLIAAKIGKTRLIDNVAV